MLRSYLGLLAGTALSLSLATGWSGSAQAQDTSPSDEDTAAVLDTVIVTSRRRAENLQEVPESVTVFSAQDIERAGIRSLRDVADLTPNFSQLENFRPGLARIQIRGLITPQVGDPPVAFVVDGITASDLEFINQELVDIEQIEVLRGAQGALYGRGAIGGAINVKTKKPTNEFEGSVSAGIARGLDYRVSGVLSGPIIKDRVFFRTGAYYRDFDGLIENTFLDEDVDFIEEFGIFGKLLFDITDRTHLDINGRYTTTDAGLGYFQNVSADTIEDFSIQVDQNILGIDERDVYEINARLEHEFDFATFELVGGYSESDQEAFSDGDFGSVPSDFGGFFFAAGQENILSVESFTIESRLTSNSDGRFRWAIGGFYQDRTRDSTFNSFDDVIGNVELDRSDFGDDSLAFSILDLGTSEAFALSAQFNFDITEKLELTGALRYDEDERTSVDTSNPIATAVSDTFDAFQPKVSLAYQATPDVLIYGGYSRGFRSGGFNEFSPLIERVFDQEQSDSYEAGFKATVLDGLFLVNGAYFRIDQDDAQFTRFNIDSFTLENISFDRTRSQGIELEVQMQPTDQLKLTVNGGYIDSEILESDELPALVGLSVPFVADFNINAIAEYEMPITDDFNLVLRGDVQSTGSRSFNVDTPDITSSTRTFANARVTVESDHWTMSAYANNIFGRRQIEDLFLVGNSVIDLARFPSRRAQFGLEVKYKF